MKVLVLILFLMVGCSSANSNLTTGHQFYTDFDWSFSETCSTESESVKISEELFSVGSTVCEIENYEDGHISKITLENCISGEKPELNKTVIIRTTYNSTIVDGWDENSYKLYRCETYK